MFKLVVLSALIAVAAAGYVSPIAYTIAENHGYAKVGEVVQHVPTAVSHQSATIVHNKATRITPLVAPVLQKTIIGSPLVYSHGGPAVLSKVVSAPANVKYIEPVRTVKYVSSPLVYSAPRAVHAW